MDFNSGWKFTLQAAPEAYQSAFDDHTWCPVRLPHDWSVEASFSPTNEGCTGYLPGGIGWYRKHFPSPAGVRDKVTYLLFDGVYEDATVWLNGKKLGFHPYGFSPFYYNLTGLLHTNGEENVVAVKVDHSHYADCRWYSGSGIYRNVKLITTAKLHIPVWGTFITTPKVTAKSATAVLTAQVENDFSGRRTFELRTDVLNPAGEKVALQADAFSVSGGGKQVCTQRLVIKKPLLWDPDHPNIYTAVTRIVEDGEIVDCYKTPFGIRTLRFDPAHGFFLNGKHTLIKGVCLHDDGGLVGTAVPPGVWRYRLEELKAAGCNAIRTAHNPPSAEFLRLCDRMGFMVMEEFFDQWDYPKDKRDNGPNKHTDYITRGYCQYFEQWAERDLSNSMLRDRNHPSIIMWSLGNEIEWTYPQCPPASGYFGKGRKKGFFWSAPLFPPAEMRRRYEAQPKTKYMIGPTAQKLSRWTKQLDTTRPVVANLILPCVSYVSGYVGALDIVGYSYRRDVYDYGHKYFPNKMILGTENTVQWPEWQAVIERPFIAGTFLWTGVDYLGEANNKWPVKGTASGMLDLAGFKKPSYYMFKSLWCDQPEIYIATQTMKKSPYRLDQATGKVVEKKPGSWRHGLWFWQPVNEYWNYETNELIAVEVYSNCKEVELFLNGKSLGAEHLGDFPDRIYKWAVPFAAGKLMARGKHQGRVVQTELVTATAPVRIQLTADHKALRANGRDVVRVVAQLVDAKGNPVRAENREITFSLSGAGTILGVDNGATNNVQKFQSNKIMTAQGRCLLLIQSQMKPSTLKVAARALGLESTPLIIKVK